MIKNLIILPNQLFKEIETMEIENMIFYEAKEYFLKYNYNKKKIILHRASMQNFYNELIHESKNQNTKITYFNYKTELKDIIKDFDSLSIFDPINKGIKKKIKDLCSALDIDLSILESPNFLSSNKYNKEFFKDNDFFQHKYYQMQRKRLNILLDADGKPEGGKWSFDSKNRKKFPKDVEIPELPEFNNDYLEEAKSYTAENFADNLGNLENFCYPISRREAEELLDDFIENKLEKFGSYQDGFEKEIVFGFHSLISSSLNIGLLNPKQVVDKVLNYYNENEIPLASVEGFIRQITGWREYVRAIYQLESEKMIKSNFFKHQRDFPQKFYRAESEIEVLDDSIKKAVDYAYSHHIERLMVLGNFFLLCELDKDQVFKWFMEMYIDAYEWVMFANVYGMSQYSYPEMMTKPYISSSNYILKMSHYKKGEWSKIWDGLYWHFISKNKDKFSDTPRMSLMLSLLDRMDQEKIKHHIKRADKFLEKLNDNNK
ncbi:cryptochrome/photolyase family protein [Halanaerobium congolense]|jgi:deoxyribodipyrimidine photolyase-related protein|uniref:cryptochrome/photolyase family protein n=1 Tax=Halanaerobium congolense TaxID=54121 RepID=UPI0008831AFA|nr:cryptochrome/photolyase family protein [Halanaerobium congolense]SDH12197.1 deoxyribodipyrimidine photolyase-related protein [Halanaerobium congolense]SHN08254.1 deoxyribodipyrimidine photolyase-related protein [Halanaerobium congolense]